MSQVRLSGFGLEKVPRRSRNEPHVVLPSGPRVKTPDGLKLTGHLRDENTGHLEREATGRRDSLGTRLIYSLMFLDSAILFSLNKKRKTPVKKKKKKKEKNDET